MIDPVLVARLDALEHNLRRVEESHAWLGELPWTQWQRKNMPGELCKELEATIGQEAKNARSYVQNIRQQLQQPQSNGGAPLQDLPRAWQGYTKAWQYSQRIFAECLEYIGGLALRDKTFKQSAGLEQRICQVADELIRKCAVESTNTAWHSLTVPALQESLTKTLARIIRLRFPEWTIWSLPLTAHEYGHVVFKDRLNMKRREKHRDPWDWPSSIERAGELLSSSQRRFRNEERSRLATDNAAPPWPPRTGRDREDDPEDVKQRADLYYEEFLADAFAAYTMGPAYACSMVLLRFNPVTAYDEDDGHPADAWRAHIVFSMLRRMDAEKPDEKPYRWVIEQLEGCWRAMLDGARPTGSLEECDKRRIETLVDDIWTIFDQALLPAARYPRSTKGNVEGSWRVAQQWAEKWDEHIRNHEYAKEISGVLRTHTLRDALNAAWLCRLRHPDKVESITHAARALCDAIIKAQRRGTTVARSVGAPDTERHIPALHGEERTS